VPVVIEVILERVTNISMGTEIDKIKEFEELAISREDAPTRHRIAGLTPCRNSPPPHHASSPSCPSWTALPRRGQAASTRWNTCPYEGPRQELAARLLEHGPEAGAAQPAGRRLGRRRSRHRLPSVPSSPNSRSGVARAIEYAQALAARSFNCLAGKVPTGRVRRNRRTPRWSPTCASRRAAARAGIRLLIEPINTFDIPGFFLDPHRAGAGADGRSRLDNLFLQYDIYHAQRMEGELAGTLPPPAAIGHIQLADNPGRNEPGTGEINYAFLFRHLDALGWKGYIGCEYKPRTTTPKAWAGSRHRDDQSGLKLGFIGLGVMGAPMAGHLLQAGHLLFVHTRSKCRRRWSKAAPPSAPRARRGRARRHRVPDAAGHAGRGSGAVRRIRRRRRPAPGKAVVDCSSIDPIATRASPQRIQELGCDYLDAPVSGGEVGAKAASLSIMVGGSERPSSACSRCWRSWARTSPTSAASATARSARSPTRSSWR
jgi:hydroxypyruvate isomerase